MSAHQITASAEEILDFMKSHGFPVFHLSNIFRRDFQYAVRDYYRAKHNKDVGTRIADEYSKSVIADLEQKGTLRKHSLNTWVVHSERYLLPAKPDTKKEAASA